MIAAVCAENTPAEMLPGFDAICQMDNDACEIGETMIVALGHFDRCTSAMQMASASTWAWASEVGALGVVFVATVEGVTPASKRTYRVARTRRGWEGDYLGMFGHIWEQWTTRAFASPEAAMASVEATHSEYVRDARIG